MTVNAPAYLLHHLARLRCQLPFTIKPLYTPGDSNFLADFCSRLFHLDDDAFLKHLNTHYPVQPSWTLVTPPKEVLLPMNSALSKTLPPLAWPQNPNNAQTPPGICGRNSVKTYGVTRSLVTSLTQSLCYKSLRTATAQAWWLPAVLQSELEQWREPFMPWGRRSPHWDV
jgi:hypothetical protein